MSNKEIPIKKNEEYILDIIDNGYEGEGIGKIVDFTIFVPGTIKGEKVKIVIVKVTSSHAFGKVLEFIKKQPERKEPDCQTYKKCGGCNLRHMDYQTTLVMKREIVQNLVNKTLNTKIRVNPTIGMEEPYYYRNKAQYPMGKDKQASPITGIYAKRSHEIVPMEECKIQSKESQEIVKFIVRFVKENKIEVYDENTQKGLLRHVVIKVGKATNEIMCILVLNGKKFDQEKEFVSNLTKEFPNVKTIVKNINTKNTNVILGNENIILYGDGFIYDKLNKYKFKISPLSFYQINPIQTEKLYEKARELAQLKKDEIIFDLYCGIGTISIFMANDVQKVYGIEIIEQAVQDARQNCQINQIENTEFITGDVENVLEELVKKEKIIPDVVFVDPPRKGLDKHTIEIIKELKIKKVIYISCNPATLVRDLYLLEEDYAIKEIQPVDMFPFTIHVEVVSVLGLKK